MLNTEMTIVIISDFFPISNLLLYLGWLKYTALGANLELSICDDNNLYFVRDLATCEYEANQISVDDGKFIFDSNVAVEDEGMIKSYILHDKVEEDLCQELAPNFEGRCVDSYLVSVFLRDKHPTSRFQAHTVIYGLFDFEGRDLLTPLKGWIYFSPEKGHAFLKEKRDN